MRITVNKSTSCSTCLRRQKTVARKQKLNDLRRVTLQELCEVNLATIREGVNHCRWPREVIERFMAVQA